MSKFIVLRGPSGSGKSTVAKELFSRAANRACLLEQDYYRFIFKPAGGGGKANSDTIHKMIKSNVLTALEDGYDVILEGILSVKSYSRILDEIFEVHPDDNYMYYFDISFSETVRRHGTRPDKSQDFGAAEMKEWYPVAHKSNHELEQVIPESFTMDDTVGFILGHSMLSVS